MNNEFRAMIVITPECDEHIAENDIREWLEQLFAHCDLGTVKIGTIIEKLPPLPGQITEDEVFPY